MCEITTALHITSSARPHFEPGHVTPRSPLLCVLNQNHDEFLNGLNCGFVTRCIFSSSPLFSREYCSNSSRERLKKRHRLQAQIQAYCKLAPHWPGQIQPRSWLADSVLLTEGGLPESREQWRHKKKKNSELHHAPPLSRFGLITGKSFVLRLY